VQVNKMTTKKAILNRRLADFSLRLIRSIVVIMSRQSK
jgi:hypothetical protein